jgi:hypothetical protein
MPAVRWHKMPMQEKEIEAEEEVTLTIAAGISTSNKSNICSEGAFSSSAGAMTYTR